MPFALVFVGLIMVVVGVRGTQTQMSQLLVSDFTGPGNFTYWIAALFIVGAVGYIKPLQPVSRAFLVLIVVGIFIANGGFAQQLQTALQQGPTPTQGTPLPALGGSSSSSSSSSSGSSDVSSWVSTAAKVLPFLL